MEVAGQYVMLHALACIIRKLVVRVSTAQHGVAQHITA